MKACAIATTSILVCLTVSLAIAQEFRSLTGRYALTTSRMIDPMSGEKPDRIIIFIEGEAAKDIYYGMISSPAKDQCAGDILSKKAGNLVCSKLDAGKFFCTLGVGLRDGQVLNGRAC